MDLDDMGESCKQCFKLNVEVLDKLNITFNTNHVLLWNKFQLFLYENLNLHASPTIFLTEFKVFKVILDNNNIYCLDYSGNVHSSPIKYMNVENIFKHNPQIQNVVTMVKLEEDSHIVTLQNITDKYYLCVHLASNLQHHTKYEITASEDKDLLTCKDRDKYVLKCFPMSSQNAQGLWQTFKGNIDENISANYVILMSLDGRYLYGFILNTKSVDERLHIVDVYSCPSEISDVHIIETNQFQIIIALKTGSLIRLQYEGERKISIMHLNVPIYKSSVINNEFYYTDGCTMWKIDRRLSKNELCFKQIFVKLTKDFIAFRDRVVCVTFSNMIYTFLYDKENSYIIANLEDKYHNASKVIDNSEQLINKLMFEIKSNTDITKKLAIEDNYTAAIALANRQDVMEKVLQYTINVYDSYEEVIQEDIKNITLTNKLEEYFQCDSTLILIQVGLSDKYRSQFNETFSNLIGILKFHITLSVINNILKTISIGVDKLLDKTNYLTVVNSKDIHELKVELKLICPIPDPLQKKQFTWILLSAKSYTLNSEHFINTTSLIDNNIIHLKKKSSEENIKNLLLKTSEKHHGLLFDFKNIDSTVKTNEFSYYIILPNDYESILCNKDMYGALSAKRAEMLSKKLGTNDFLKLNHIVLFYVKKHKVKLQVVKENDDDICLKISGDHLKIVFHIRNYFAGLLLKKNHNSEQMTIPQAQYTALENLQKKLKVHLCSKELSEEFILKIGDQVNKMILGSFTL